MKKIIVVLLLALVLVACGGTKTTTTVCSTTYEGINVENTLVSIGDKVQTIKYVNTMTIDETLFPYIQSAVEEYEESANGVEGLTYEWSMNGNELTEITTIDYNKVNLSDLVDLDLLEEVDGKVPTFISLEASIENMKELGCTCTEK